jgi:hypothetical protein
MARDLSLNIPLMYEHAVRAQVDLCPLMPSNIMLEIQPVSVDRLSVTCAKLI